MGNPWHVTPIVLLVLAGCGSGNDAAKPSSKAADSRQRPAVAATGSAGSASQPPSSVAPGPVRISALPTQELTPQVIRERYAKYHWPANFNVPFEIQLALPEIPPEIAGPSPPIETSPDDSP